MEKKSGLFDAKSAEEGLDLAENCLFRLSNRHEEESGARYELAGTPYQDRKSPLKLGILSSKSIRDYYHSIVLRIYY